MSVLDPRWTLRLLGASLVALGGACSSGASSSVDDASTAGDDSRVPTESGDSGTVVIASGDSGVVTGSDAGHAATSDDSGASGAATDSGVITGPPATGAGGAACPSLTGPADRSYPRWPVSNPVATHLPNPSSYADNGDGTVTDHVTGLVWQKVVSGSDTYAGAPAYCAGLTLPAPAGLTWHVPTRVELLSILDPTTGAGVDAPFLASGQPPGGKYTWTSTPWVVSQIATKPQDAWMVNYGGGGGLTSNAAAQSAVEWIRCVAAPAVTPLPYPHYVQVAAGEVQDVETGLVWAQASHNVVMTQTAAAAYCTSLGLGGHTWRLPGLNELVSLVDDNPDIGKVSPAIDQCVFADTSANGYYISASTWGTTPWGLNYEDGFTFNKEPQLPDAGDGMPGGFVKCVR